MNIENKLQKYQNKTKSVVVGGVDIIPYVLSLVDFISKLEPKVKPLPVVHFKHDETNAENVFGKTAFYDPEKKEVTLFVTNRLHKDVLRSLSHEIRHHYQNMIGKLNDRDHDALQDPNYTRKDKHLFEMEADAYLYGSGIWMRSWEDSIKFGD